MTDHDHGGEGGRTGRSRRVPDPEQLDHQRTPPSLTDPLLRGAVEGRVSAHLGRSWTAREVRDLRELACHPSALLSDGDFGAFAKYSDAPDGREQFEIELAGLQLLADRAGVLTPPTVGVVEVDGGCLLVLHAIQAIERGPEQWREIGRTLARIHSVRGERSGLHRQGYIGPLPQDNRWMDDWSAFYAQRRLEPALRLAIASGNLPVAAALRVERLIARLPELCGPEVAPALLHGDAQQNNFISTREGVVAIDPAVHFGHPEMDLAFLGCWQEVPEDVLAGYRSELSIDPGFPERRDLWRVWAYLGGVTVEGASHLGRLTSAVSRYL